MSYPNHQSGASGVVALQSAPLTRGASNHRDAAQMYRLEQNSKQNAMNKSGGKKRRKKTRRKIKGGAIVVPSFSTSGPQVSGGSQNPNTLSAGANSTATQGGANSVCDGCFKHNSSPVCSTPQCGGQSGGCGGSQCGGYGGDSGLIPDGQPWGCMSGGIRRRTKSKKSKKSKKSRKSRKSRKSKKSRKIRKTKKSKK